MKAKTIRNLKVFGVEIVEELIIGVLYYLTWFRKWTSDFPVWGKVVVGLLAVVATSVLIDAILLIFTRLRSTISSSYNSRKYREDEEEYRKNHPNEFDYAGNRIYPDDDDDDDNDDDIYDDDDDEEEEDEEEEDEEKAEYDAAYEAGRKAAARFAAYQAGYSDYMNSLNKKKTEEATNETSEEEKPENSEEVDA